MIDYPIDLLIRSHEVKDEGYEVEPDGNVITIFSAPNYCDQMGNKGALIRLKGKTLKPNFVKFSAVVRLDLKTLSRILLCLR